MKSNMLAATIAAVMLLGSLVFTPTASAQPASVGGSSNYLVPVVVGAAAGATVGALLWPAVVVPAGVAMAAPAAAAGMGWGWGAFMTTRAAVGAILGGGLGYLAAR
jgi:hypothetical protein